MCLLLPSRLLPTGTSESRRRGGSRVLAKDVRHERALSLETSLGALALAPLDSTLVRPVHGVARAARRRGRLRFAPLFPRPTRPLVPRRCRRGRRQAHHIEAPVRIGRDANPGAEGNATPSVPSGHLHRSPRDAAPLLVPRARAGPGAETFTCDDVASALSSSGRLDAHRDIGSPRRTRGRPTLSVQRDSHAALRSERSRDRSRSA